MLIKKGILCFIVDEEGNRTNSSINMDIDRELDIGDIFNWKPNRCNGQDFKVVVFMDFFPLVVEME